MSQRIRYVSYNSDNNLVLTSHRSFQAEDKAYDVLLFPSDNSFEIRLAGTDNVVHTGKAVSLSSLKIAAKKVLASLGVPFNSETRSRNQFNAE